ncbi:hypothetical protein Taro_032478 [Colocasia esculenta]|uniref:Dof zinc finger protein n=1 Tax=Colocasia esculenta TaxID=4460 RepID=A0A843W405_COLES|nr:hypothetical protein [Colocasia esculenta]
MLSSGENMMPYLARPSFLVDESWKPDVEQAPNCPRCDSSNTKFCYYNNYSLSQPRYFCKGCRRYWTKGGSLRNVPVGGGCRKNRRARSARLSNCARVPTSNNRECRQVQPNCIRPDLALDGPLGSSCRSSGSSTVSKMEMSASDGSNIDLALLYSRFLSQCSDDLDPAAPEVTVEVGESFELRSVVSSDHHQLPPQPLVLHQGHNVPGLQRVPADMFQPETQLSNDHLPPAGDLGICLDIPGSCSVPPALLPAAEVFANDDVFWFGSSTGAAGLTHTWQYPPLQSPGTVTLLQEDHLKLHSNFFTGGWDAFGLTNYEAGAFSRT